ncbi:hypothetical protein FPZ54_18225 [Sphingomonas suaedae]|uniref:Uncharacterized protein n=1 Tax=Sphingomonas suaedae TaxID=2599297 RepID=A0A518RJX6_9SPHN|nr:hypothetical protein [Sphingomonas suaedae]QDX27752.1 hypothetical protein FPZ54_18225 [Sphingomonas suaedae]
MKTIWLALPLAAALTACGDGEGTTISIEGDNGSVTAKADKDGRVEVKAPGFEGSIKLPRFRMDADNFDIDGVKLYPGSTISSLNIEDRGGDAAKGGVRVAFDAPADAERVRAWFREQMEGAGFTVTGNRAELTGKTGKGSPYTLKIDPAGEGKSRGTLSVTEG